MRADPNDHEQGAPAEPTVNQAHSYGRWEQIGRHALRLARPSVLRPLRAVLAECEGLIVHEHWLANAQNLTKTGEALGISRRRVRLILKRWLAATESREGGQD